MTAKELSNIFQSLHFAFILSFFSSRDVCGKNWFGYRYENKTTQNEFYEQSQYDLITPSRIGWGTLKEDGKPSCILQEVEVPIMSNDDCTTKTNYTSKMITNNMMCAGYPGVGLKDSCQGDSGVFNVFSSVGN